MITKEEIEEKLKKRATEIHRRHGHRQLKYFVDKTRGNSFYSHVKKEDMPRERKYAYDAITTSDTVTPILAQADGYRKRERFVKSFESLEEADRQLQSYPDTNKERYFKAIQARAYRLANDIATKARDKSSLVTAQRAMDLASELERRLYAKKTAKLAIATTALIGILGGIATLSFNAKTIQLSPGTEILSNSNFVVGIIFLAIGILAGFFWIKPKIKKKKKR